MGYQNVAHYKPFATKKETKVKVENATERRLPQSDSWTDKPKNLKNVAAKSKKNLQRWMGY
jgi:hypothetical protein